MNGRDATRWWHILITFVTGIFSNTPTRAYEARCIETKKEKTINPLWIGKMFPNNAKWIDCAVRSPQSDNRKKQKCISSLISVRFFRGWIERRRTRISSHTHRWWPRRNVRRWLPGQTMNRSTWNRTAKRKCETCKLKRTNPLCAQSTNTRRHRQQQQRRSGAFSRRKKQQDISRSKMMQFILFFFRFIPTSPSLFFSIILIPPGIELVSFGTHRLLMHL